MDNIGDVNINDVIGNQITGETLTGHVENFRLRPTSEPWIVPDTEPKYLQDNY